MLESQASSCHVTYDVTVTVNEPSTSTEMSDTFLAVKPSTSTETSDSTSTVEPSTSTEANDTALPVAEPSTSSETTEHAPAVEPCTSLSDDMDTEEVSVTHLRCLIFMCFLAVSLFFVYKSFFLSYSLCPLIGYYGYRRSRSLEEPTGFSQHSFP